MTGRSIHCAFLGRCAFLAALFVTAALPLSAQAPDSGYLHVADHVCKSTLPDGTRYEAWDRVFATTWKGQPLYVKLRAYYRPGSGEILWRSTGYSKTGYASLLKYSGKTAGSSCGEFKFNHHILFLQDGEWVDFWDDDSRIVVFHCNLKFGTREKAWAYVAKHWRDSADDPSPSTTWASEIHLQNQLGREFFRPKRLEFDARPYSYNSLGSVKKVGSNWELELKGADKPNRATVLLDSEFKTAKVTKNADSGH